MRRFLKRLIRSAPEPPHPMLDWILPLTATELVHAVDEGIEGAMPEGWGCHRDGEDLAWRVVPADPGARGWEEVEYNMFATSDLKHLIITHDNSDAGALSPDHFEHTATVIDAVGIKRYGLEGYFRMVFTTKKPNYVSLT